MPTFRYKALQTDGAVAEGQLEASGGPTRFARWKVSGCARLVFNKAQRTKKKDCPSLGNLGDCSFKLQSQRVSAKALENFTRLLSSLLAAGCIVEPGLVILYRKLSTPSQRRNGGRFTHPGN